MFNKDYIMRMIELLVQGIAKIMHLKQEHKYEESAELLTETLRQFYGLNDRSVEQLPWEDLMAVANLGGLPDAEKCALLAQLIREKADLESHSGRNDMAAELYVKALDIYISALLADTAYNIPEHRGNIDELIGIAGKYAFPLDTLQLLFQYYELAGRYGKAEDTLYRLLENDATREEAKEQGRAFYKRLLLMNDNELQNGNLPRDEVADGLRKLSQ